VERDHEGAAPGEEDHDQREGRGGDRGESLFPGHMERCRTSSCTCSPKVSYAFATSVSWPTGDAPLCSRFAFSCSARYKNPQPIRTSPPPMTRTTLGAAPSVVDGWWSSKGSRLQKSNFVLHRCSLPHETTLSNSNPSRVSACSLPLPLAAEQISSSRLLGAIYAILFRASQPLLSSAMFYRTVSATLHTAVSSHSISIGPASAATTSGFLLAA
jgi:hypothetical protein